MSVIDIKNFGGEMPSASARALTGNAAQMAKNLVNSSNEFVPLATSAVLATSESVINPGSAVLNPKSMYRTAYLADGSPNTSILSGWMVNGGDVNVVRGQVHGVTSERTYYTATSPRKFAWQDGQLVDRPMGIPAPLLAPVTAHLVVDELRGSELDAAATASVSLIENTLWSQTTAVLVGCGMTFADPSPTVPGWLNHPSDSTRKLLLVPMAGGAIRTGFEYLLNAVFGGAQVTWSGNPYWQLDIAVAAVAWTVDGLALKAALLDLDDPVLSGQPLLTEADATLTTSIAVNYFSTGEEPQLGLINTALDKTRALQRVLTATQSGSANAAFYASANFTAALNTLIGDGTVEGSVTNAILGYVYVMTANSAWGTPGNVTEFIAGTTRYWQPDFEMYGGYTPAEGRGLIRADLAANIVTAVSGVKTFNYDAMAALVRAEFNLIVGRRPAASQNHYRPLLEGWITEVLAPLKAFFDPDALTRLSFGLAGSDTAESFSFLLGDAAVALQRVTTLYNQMRGSVATMARKIFDHPDISTQGAQADASVIPIIDSRFYIATYVTDWGEESAPSPVSAMVEVDQNDQVSVTIAPPADRPDIVKWRLYRSNVGSATAAFQMLYEGFINSQVFGDTPLVFLDAVKSAELDEVCPTLTWLEPEPTLEGLVGMPNGILAGHFGNTVAFSEPYVPYAWPIQYQVTTETTIVGLGVFGQTLFVGTTGSPYFISGSDSASMSALKLESSQACVSRRSIVALDGGIIYASPDGLCLADSSGVKLITRALWSHEGWQALEPSTIFAASHEGAYVFVCNNGTRLYVLGDGKLTEVDLGELGLSAVYTDKSTGTLCAAAGIYIVAAFLGTSYRLARWKTPLITLERQQPMAWAQVYGQHSAEFPATVRWYGDGVLRHTMTFTSLQPQRLPPGRWLEHEVEIESAARITRVMLASTSEELKAI